MESKTPTLLEAFSLGDENTKGGYGTSYYLEPYDFKYINKEDLILQEKLIRELYAKKIINYISSDSHNYYFIRENLEGIPVLSWSFEPHPVVSVRTYINRFHFFRLRWNILTDDKVAVLLFGYTAKKGNL